MDVSFVDVDRVNIEPKGNYLLVEIEGVDARQAVEQFGTSDLLSEMDIDDVILHYGDELVDKIKDQNDLTEAE